MKTALAAVGTTSDGLWAPIIVPESVLCICCRKLIEPGEEAMCSPGRWVRHTTCQWPRDNTGHIDSGASRL